ncbi:MAG TPA: ADP-ribose pyrophosphatase [Firmicutes bacterium]|nr:ADP-ribose pyrophosphatase [Bacillota bacterium]
MELRETLIGSEYFFHGMINMRLDQVRTPNGSIAQRVVAEHPGAAAIVTVNQDGRLVLVRQYRHPIGRELLEIPAGKLDGGEPPEQCAARELSEETGLQPIELLELGKIVTAPGFCNEGITLFFARGVPQQGAKASQDADEFIEIELLEVEQAFSAITQGQIIDAKTICGLMMARAKGLL